MLPELLLLLVIMAAAGLWLDIMRQHEHALVAAHRLCDEQDVQLLDQTVGLTRIRLRRHYGRLSVERHYRFEVSTSGSDRQYGTVRLVQGRLVGFHAPWRHQPPTMPNFTPSTVVQLVDHASRDRFD